MTTASPAATPAAPSLAPLAAWTKVLSVLGSACAVLVIWGTIDLDPGFLTSAVEGAASSQQVGTWFVLAFAAVFAVYAAVRFIVSAALASAAAGGRAGNAAKALSGLAALLLVAALITGEVLGFGFGALLVAMLVRIFALPASTAPVSAA